MSRLPVISGVEAVKRFEKLGYINNHKGFNYIV